jgi:hypothetical protein
MQPAIPIKIIHLQRATRVSLASCDENFIKFSSAAYNRECASLQSDSFLSLPSFLSRPSNHEIVIQHRHVLVQSELRMRNHMLEHRHAFWRWRKEKNSVQSL